MYRIDLFEEFGALVVFAIVAGSKVTLAIETRSGKLPFVSVAALLTSMILIKMFTAGKAERTETESEFGCRDERDAGRRGKRLCDAARGE